MGPDYIRVCPTCGTKNAPDVMRCGCGAMLFGVDLTRAGIVPESAPARVSAASPPAKAATVCPYGDCGQANPPDVERCVYCNRPLASGGVLTPAGEIRSLVSLPPALAERYRIVRPFPTVGAEAELLLVQPASGGEPAVAKIYRQGLHPRSAVQERVARVDARHRIRLAESGSSGGHAFEVMEYCAHGSLRDRIGTVPVASAALVPIARELAAAIAAVHAAGLVHRDLKPENVLVRSAEPLELVLIDFGIASVLDATQRFTGAARTLPYASPESLSGVIDGKADYWALGMILLEAALGNHPFAGLSEAVILHHLATRGIDVAGVRDGNVRKLLKGLLLRDPRARWGREEIARWLAGDTTLAEPAEQALEGGFTEPYHLAQEICTTREQLAIALSRHWAAGISDLGNGQLLAWFRDVQKDQNTVRLLIELQYERQMHLDVRLLKLLLHLAPGIPPVWRGENIELPAILARANLALKGDADAARWLNALHAHRVLEAYAGAGNAAMADIVRRWNAAVDGFAKAWEDRLAFLKARRQDDPDEIAAYDDLVYGKTGPERPHLISLHPRLLALAYDAAWSERLRGRLVAELAEVTVHCPWLAEIGDPLRMDPASLLVLESLLPEARKAVDRQKKADARRREAEVNELREMKVEAAALIGNVKATARERILTPVACDELRGNLERLLELLARAQGAGRSDEAFLEFRRSLKRAEPNANHLMTLLGILAERRAVNSGWLGTPTLVFAGLALLLAPRFLGALAFYALAIAVVIVLVWRLAPNYFTIQNIRSVAARL